MICWIRRSTWQKKERYAPSFSLDSTPTLLTTSWESTAPLPSPVLLFPCPLLLLLILLYLSSSFYLRFLLLSPPPLLLTILQESLFLNITSPSYEECQVISDPFLPF